jgi:hypothetical protein
MEHTQLRKLGACDHDTIGMPQTERVQQHRFQYAHDRGIRPDAERNR